jgi:hypothetical protein
MAVCLKVGYVGGLLDRFGQLARPFVKGRAVAGGADPVVEASAQLGTGLQQDHPLPGLGGGQGGGSCRRAAADDGDLGFQEKFVVLAFHFVVGGDDAQAGGLADLLAWPRAKWRRACAWFCSKSRPASSSPVCR